MQNDIQELVEKKASDVDESIHRNNYKLTADKIIQILEVVRDEGRKSRRRWIWELMQNAKDVPNYYKRVSFKIHLAETKLSFHHNGDPFSIDNITGLIQQVSSKHSNNEDKDVTGKFGTGFISTHLLSDIIEVQGIVRRPEGKYRRFGLELDRSGKTSEELLPSIEASLEEVRTIDVNDTRFPAIENYVESRQESHLDTIFSYLLKDEDNQKAAQVGVEDLKFTLPFTMVNIPKIKQVEIINEVDDVSLLYSCEVESVTEEISRYTIEIANKKTDEVINQKFISYCKGEVRLIAEVKDFKCLELIPLNGAQPYLYRDFPLIGTEKFYLPFVLNGFTFYPTEKRDKILLNQAKDKSLHNRQLLESARELSLVFADWLIENDASSLFVLANTGLPEMELEEESLAWFTEFQTDWRKGVLSKKVVETELGKIELGSAVIPRFSDNDLQNEIFYDFVKEYGLGDVLPKKLILSKWLYYLGNEEELHTWNKKMLFTAEDLIREIEGHKNLAQLAEKRFNNSESNAVAWLNRLFDFITESDIAKLLDTHMVVPDKNGDFKLLSSLHLEKEAEPIPDLLLATLKELGVDWYSKLILGDIKLKNITHSELGLLDASEVYNTEINKESVVNGKTFRTFLQIPNAEKILAKVLSLASKDSEEDSFRSKLFQFGNTLFHFDYKPVPVRSLKGLSFDRTTRLYIEMINRKISGAQNLTMLATHLNMSFEQTCEWLNSYLCFVQSSGLYRYLVEIGNVIPNRYGEFRSYVEVLNNGSSGQLLDDTLIGVLKLMTKTRDLNKMLLHDSFGVELKDSIKFEELAGYISEEVSIVSADESYEIYRDPIITLINWCKKHGSLARYYLPDFYEKANRYFYILAIEKSENSEQIFSLLKNKESLGHLVAISESGVDLNMLNQLVSVVTAHDILKELIDHALFLQKEKEDFDFLLNLGQLVESVFGKALNKAVTQYSVEYIGIGSHDYKITNTANKKSFFIEIKSFGINNQNEPIRLSMSQARLSVTAKENFALCTIPRPQQAKLITEDYIERELVYVGALGVDAEKSVKSYDLINQMINTKEDVFLEAVKMDVKVGVTRGYINTKRFAFSDLISVIHNQLK